MKNTHIIDTLFALKDAIAWYASQDHFIPGGFYCRDDEYFYCEEVDDDDMATLWMIPTPGEKATVNVRIRNGGRMQREEFSFAPRWFLEEDGMAFAEDNPELF